MLLGMLTAGVTSNDLPETSWYDLGPRGIDMGLVTEAPNEVAMLGSPAGRGDDLGTGLPSI